MKKYIQYVIAVICLALLAGCSGTSATTQPGASKASVAISFAKAGKAAVKSSTLQELGISRLTLDVIPANSSSYRPAQIDLAALYTSSGVSATIDNLTDNETYLFRVMAYDAAGNFLYGGQSSADIPPVGSLAISVVCNQFSNFSTITGAWNGTVNGGSISLNVGSDGTATGTDNNGYPYTSWFTPASTSGTFDMTGFETITRSPTDISTIVISGTTSGSTINGSYISKRSGETGTWTVTKGVVPAAALTWSAYIEGLNSYNQPISSSSAFQGGYAYIAPSLVNNSYYWSEFLATSSVPLNGDNLMVEAYLRNNQSDGGLSCYDTSIMLYDKDPNGTPFAAFWLMTPGCASYASIAVRPVGGTNVDLSNISELAVDLAAWHKVAIKTKGNKMQVYYDDKVIKEVSYTGSLGMLKTMRFHFKGSGRVDWVKVYENEALKYTEDFNASGPTTYTVTPSAGTGGTISPATVQNVSSGATTSFTITPSSGYSIASVTGCGGTLSGATYTTGPVSADCSIAVGFVSIAAKNWYWTGNTLNVQSGNGSPTILGTDIKSVAFTNDSQYLYWSMELYDGPPNTDITSNLSTNAGYDVVIRKADGFEINSRVNIRNGGWVSFLATKPVGGQYSDFQLISATTAINGKIPLSILGSSDIKSFPNVGAYVYLGGNTGTIGVNTGL